MKFIKRKKQQIDLSINPKDIAIDVLTSLIPNNILPLVKQKLIDDKLVKASMNRVYSSVVLLQKAQLNAMSAILRQRLRNQQKNK